MTGRESDQANLHITPLFQLGFVYWLLAHVTKASLGDNGQSDLSNGLMKASQLRPDSTQPHSLIRFYLGFFGQFPLSKGTSVKLDHKYFRPLIGRQNRHVTVMYRPPFSSQPFLKNIL